jgi:NADP-dependent 3-hydroxy acid dehydrogenase YdfG
MNRVVLVTGACGGIGSALSRRFVELGDTVLALDLDAEALEALAAGLGADRVTPVVADLADAAAVQRAVAQAVKLRGPVDVLVANAGGAKAGTLASTDITSWQRDVNLNLNGTYYTVEAVRASMIERQQGVLVLIGSVNGMAALYAG